MLEIPESKTIARQAANTLSGKTISAVHLATSPHKFAFFNGDPALYPDLLKGKKVMSARGHGMFVDVCLTSDTYITVGEGSNMRFIGPGVNIPEKYQLLICFDDESSIAFTVAMYGGIWAYSGTLDNPYHRGSLSSISPLEDAFDENFFDKLLANSPRDISAKALLATEQRIPGLGNGVLQDILFYAAIHPKQKKSSFTDEHRVNLFHSIKTTLGEMTLNRGRDTEKDFLGDPGGYKTILSKNTVGKPCPKCGSTLTKEAYLGGAIYFCPTCQKLRK